MQVLADGTGLPPQIAKGVLWGIIQEWEKNHEQIVEELTIQRGL